MAAYFTELNRKRPPAGPLDYVTHTTCPTVHAADDRSVMETNEALRHQILSTRAFMGDGLAYRIGPSQIGCRENPYGKAPAPNPGNGRVCLSHDRPAPARPLQRRLDPRLRGRLRARRDRGARLRRPHRPVRPHLPPDRLRPALLRRASTARAVYPAFHVVAGLAALDGAAVLATDVTPGGAVEALAVRDGARTILWLANLTADAVDVELPADLAGARIATLDADAFEALTRAADYLDTAARALPRRPGPPRRLRGGTARGPGPVNDAILTALLAIWIPYAFHMRSRSSESA